MGKIIVNLDVEMAKRKMSLSELAERVGLTLANHLSRVGLPAWRHLGISRRIN